MLDTYYIFRYNLSGRRCFFHRGQWLVLPHASRPAQPRPGFHRSGEGQPSNPVFFDETYGLITAMFWIGLGIDVHAIDMAIAIH